MRCLVKDIHAHAKEAVVECVSSEASKETLEQVENSFDQLGNPFHVSTQNLNGEAF